MVHKLLFLFFATSCLCLMTTGGLKTPVEMKRWVVTENSSLRVTGSTNINNFTCDITGYNNPDTIDVKNINQFAILSGKVKLNINQFNCHNNMMTKELRKTLKARQFPTLQIAFISLNAMPQLNIKPACITGVVDIVLAGINKRYIINYEFSQDDNQVIHLNGHREINFSDFDLKAPKKVGGIITAKDKLLVQFNLNLKNI